MFATEDTSRWPWITGTNLRRCVNIALIGIFVYALLALSDADQESFQFAARPGSVTISKQRTQARDRAHQYDKQYLSHLLTNQALSGARRPQSLVPANLTSTIVIGRRKAEPERVQWVYDKLRDIDHYAIYVVDDANSTLPHLSKNHGREAAVYMSYIVQNYDNLDDITIFWHTDEIVWHNNLLLKWDSVESLNSLDRANVMQQGYVPSRCDHWPGCPGWIKFNPSKAENRVDPHRLEDMFTPELFTHFFPDVQTFPPYFSGTCCSQFIVSKETILRHDKAFYQRILDWVVEYQNDERSGMVMEYTWPYIFLGRATLCPSMAECYCKTYGFCIEDKDQIDQLETWNSMRTRREELNWQLVFHENALDLKRKELDAEQAAPEIRDAVENSFGGEIQRLKVEHQRLEQQTWEAREQIIHHWKLGVPPTGW